MSLRDAQALQLLHRGAPHVSTSGRSPWMELVSGASRTECETVDVCVKGLQQCELSRKLRSHKLKVFKDHVLKVRWKRGLDRRQKQQQLQNVIDVLECRGRAWESRLSHLMGVSEREAQHLFVPESGCPQSCITVQNAQNFLASAVKHLGGDISL